MTDPSPVLLAFLVFKRFVFLELVAALALARGIRAEGSARVSALIAFVLALAGSVVLLIPIVGIPASPLYAAAARLMATGSGMLPLLVPSLFLALSAYLPGTRGRGLDFAHIGLLWILVGLWIATLVL